MSKKTFWLTTTILALAVVLGTTFFVNSVRSQEIPSEPCITIKNVLDTVIAIDPQSTIKEVSGEEMYIVFTSPNKPVDFKVTFNYEGCAIFQENIAKLSASLE